MSFIHSLIGGVLIGLAAVVMMWAVGRICGVSGILGVAMKPLCLGRFASLSVHAWRWFFLLGLMLGPLVTHHVFSVQKPPPIEANWVLILISGLLVGVGTRLGRGCTSGHGVCGMARLSMRSMLATVVFMLTGMITVYLVRHLLQG